LLAKRTTADADDRRARERLCVATRRVRPVGELIRFVVAPDATLTPDLRRRLPGRGVWVTASRQAFLDAVRRQAFARALKCPVQVAPDLVETIDRLLERSALDMLSLANKAGLVVSGFAKVARLVESKNAAALIEAEEAADDGARKLAAAVHRTYLDASAPVLVTIFRSAHLDLALGRSNVIHAALGAGPATSGFLDRVAALAFWRDGDPAPAGAVLARELPPRADVEPSARDDRPATDGSEILDRGPGLPAGFGTE
jgi:predicted RNA-binding protein YlxR (DUF448 family)